jgi:hypothetical protein
VKQARRICECAIFAEKLITASNLEPLPVRLRFSLKQADLLQQD